MDIKLMKNIESNEILIDDVNIKTKRLDKISISEYRSLSLAIRDKIKRISEMFIVNRCWYDEGYSGIIDSNLFDGTEIECKIFTKENKIKWYKRGHYKIVPKYPYNGIFIIQNDNVNIYRCDNNRVLHKIIKN